MSGLASPRGSPSRSLVATPSESEAQDIRLQDDAQHCQEDSVPLPQQRIRRVAARTMDLGRSLTNRMQTSSPSPPNSEPKRMFSLNRKGKGKETQVTQDEAEVLHQCVVTAQPSAHEPVDPRRGNGNSPAASTTDDSPFIMPPSPTLPPVLPSSQAFRGAGSMRMGMQTLIQALQALPWVDDPDNEDETSISNAPDSESDSEDERPESHMASSIHAIYRPVARSRRTEALALPSVRRIPQREVVLESSDTDPELNLVSEDVDDDFETTTPRPSSAQRSDPLATPIPPAAMVPLGAAIRRRTASRTGSMATVKLNRRVRLAEKLKEIFEVDAINEVVAEMPCWLFRSILLQGYMYLTNSHLCFFAHIPSREDQVLKSGTLSKKATRTKRWIKYWFVLKNDALSWYRSSSDPYFLNGIVDLRYAISCDPEGEKEIRLRTNQKNVYICADSVPSREEWVKAIRKVIFKAQNMGDTVKIAIPYSVVVEVEQSSAIDFSETIEVKIFDKEELSEDSYFFAYFHNIQAALEHIRDAVRGHRSFSANFTHAFLDTTTSRPHPSATHGIDRARSLPSPDSQSPSSRLSSFLRPFQDYSFPISFPRIYSAPDPPEGIEDFTHISKRGASSFVPFTTSRLPSSETGNINPISPSLLPADSASRHHTYPPSTSIGSLSGQSPIKNIASNVPWNVGVSSWLKGYRKATNDASPNTTVDSAFTTSPISGSVREIYSTCRSSSAGQSSRSANDLGYSVLETAEAVVDPEAGERFKTAFAFDDKEALLGYFSGYLFRLLPIPGRLYVSSNYFCFKSTGPLTAKTRMILPIRDILAVERSKGTRFGHYGLVVIIKGHEELFFEFGFEDRRRACVSILERQMEDIRRRPHAGDIPALSPGKRDALILEEFEPRESLNNDSDPAPVSEAMSESLPAVMFTSASSTFLTFKPKESLRFTFLTIGSRGDVQPYIALAKGLMADGHKVKIATHGEFKTWIESYGIEYGYVGGDPAELMRICVENGTFTVSFLKEGLLKFRGWLDDLLKTSWEACQGTDVLVESPSAMGGYHIAEALKIPYFRAFTMTWTRTRVYPHAFAVPEHKMGGGYNYMSYVMFDQVFWRAISGQVNRWRRNLLHLDNTSLDRMEPHKIPFLYNFSPSVVPPPLDWPEWIRVTGYWFLDDADVGSKKWTPPPGLLSFIESAHQARRKVVYIGFGSIVVSDPKAMTRCVIEAIVQSGVYAILSKGWSDRLQIKATNLDEPEEPLPKQVYSISSIPHDWLFQRIDAACHHGGAGTTGASLRAGIPTVIKPFFGDQFFWADRVEALGVGSGVRKLTVESLKEALVLATTDQKQIDRAKLVGERIRSENGVATAVEAIYRDLDYARSLIRQPSNGVVENISGTGEEQLLESSQSMDCRSRYNSLGSQRGSEDWSVISDGEDRRLSFGSRRSEVMSVLPDALTSSTRRRSNSASSAQP